LGLPDYAASAIFLNRPKAVSAFRGCGRLLLLENASGGLCSQSMAQNDFLAADGACGLSALPDRALQYFLRYGQAEILKNLRAERVKLEFNLRGSGLGGEQAAFRTSISREKQIAFRPTRTRSGVPWQETPQYLSSHRDDRSNSNARRPPPPTTAFGPRFGRYRGYARVRSAGYGFSNGRRARMVAGKGNF
jgi:hypothetical protein